MCSVHKHFLLRETWKYNIRGSFVVTLGHSCVLLDKIHIPYVKGEHSTWSVEDTYQVQMSGAHTKSASKCPGGGSGGRVE